MNSPEPRTTAGPQLDRVYYDGECGFCQRWVKFLLARDREGSRFRFAPLGGETFQREISEDVRRGLPNSVIVQTPDGRVLSRTDAVAHLLQRLGGVWSLSGRLLDAPPRLITDAGYDAVARVRRSLAGGGDRCRLLPPELRRRFDP